MAGLAHLDLDLLFERSGNGFVARVVRSPAGEGQSAAFALPVTEVELDNFALRIGRPRVRTRRQPPEPVKAAKELGRRLFDAVFAEAVGECLRRSADLASANGVPLRIRLRLSDCPELADLPWELLYDADDDWFLALSGGTPVVRYVHLRTQPRPVPVTLPLRILAVRSEPDGYPKLDLDAEWAQVTAALADQTGSGALAITELAAPSLDELRRALLRQSFHVLHYMGHGGFDERSGGTLLFTDQVGRPVPVTGESLGVLLRDHASLRLAIINACEAARTDPADPFAGVADTLVRRGIPAVIAMQFEISDVAAIKFAPALYEALAAGRPIDTAMAEARKAIYTISPVEWATPVLYLRADDARLFDITAAPRPPQPTAAQDAAAAHAGRGDQLHFIWILDCSGSMGGDKIQQLNFAMREALPAMRDMASENPHAQVLVRAVTFSTGARWHVPTPTPVSSFTWTDVRADGRTDMGSALSMVAEQLKIPPMSDRALPPVLVLVSGSRPTDDFSGGLKALMDQPWGKRAVRLAIAVGRDANLDVLNQFIGSSELKPLQANNAPALFSFIRWAPITVPKAESAPASRPVMAAGGGNVPIPIPPQANPAAPDVW